jgi:cytochrome c oxidase subunit 2
MKLWQTAPFRPLAVRHLFDRVDEHTPNRASYSPNLSVEISEKSQTAFRRSSIVLFLVFVVVTSLAYVQEATRTIEIHAKRFSFTPNEITIRKREPVRINLISDDVTHSLVISGLRVNQEVKKGHPAEFTLSSDTAGDFQGKCGHFCGSGHGRMTFTVHVADK